MIAHTAWPFFLLLILVLVFFTGCRPAVPLSSPDRAQATLHEALDAWQRGETPEAFRGSSSIIVVERKWRDGFRLLRYEVVWCASAEF